METRKYTNPQQQTATVRQSTQMERSRRNAIGVSAVLMVMMLTLAVVFTTLAINTGGRTSGDIDLGPDEPVWVPVVMSIPFGSTVSFDIIKGYSETELQWNETAGGWGGNRSVKIAVGAGTPVLATYDGTITNIVNDALEGTIVEITHRDGLVTRYLGLSSNLNVTRGQTVTRGQQIGTVSGRPVDHKDGAHVKLEVLQNGRKVNPGDFIPNLDSSNK